MFRQFRNVAQRRDFGFGHSPQKDPGAGEMALFCAACPQPGINMDTSPEQWRKDRGQKDRSVGNWT